MPWMKLEVPEPRDVTSIMPRSSAEAEYHAMKMTVSEMLWMHWLVNDHSEPLSLYCDNQTIPHIADNLVYHKHIKHVEIDCYFVLERVKLCNHKSCIINTRNQVAYIFTKLLGSWSRAFSFSI
uniref:Reverse transcriptase Ty1/copia-type domain-containing protein n=1 Tax=Lactuca sativa TaxID=4236 RepID=A0A9R1VH89_LACSA|nr:hypothetical protein LSAT_V11C500247950 [Lactuca sativa]